MIYGFSGQKGIIIFGQNQSKTNTVYRQYLTYQSQPLPRPKPSFYSSSANPLDIFLVEIAELFIMIQVHFERLVEGCFCCTNRLACESRLVLKTEVLSSCTAMSAIYCIKILHVFKGLKGRQVGWLFGVKRCYNQYFFLQNYILSCLWITPGYRGLLI